MKQVSARYNQYTNKVYIDSNYKGDIFKEFREAGYNRRIIETLEHYASINKKQGVTREQLM